MKDIVGREIHVEDWIVFGTRMGNSAETRIAQVEEVTEKTLKTRSIRINPDDPHKYIFVKMSGRVKGSNVLKLDQCPIVPYEFI